MPLAPGVSLPAGPGESLRRPSLSGEILVQNVVWFCRLRWLAIAGLVGFGLMAAIPATAHAAGLRRGVHWPFLTAGVLLLQNVGFLLHVRRLRHLPVARWALVNLWTQIVSDLVVLTVVVYFIGSLETYAPFAYLFHIVLACIFVSRGQSLAVTLLACALYSACVLAEHTVIAPSGGIFAGVSVRKEFQIAAPAATLNFLFALAILLVVSYLASHLSAMVRDRDARLAETNHHLLAAQDERSEHMLRTTHELKAPFAAIHANTQILLNGLCGELPGPAADVVSRIAARANRLAREIQEMLQLANLESTSQAPVEPGPVDLAAVLRWCISQVEATAQARQVAIESDLASIEVVAVEDHMKMMLANVVANAVNYSHDGGRVRIRCAVGAEGCPEVTIADEGIGIPPAKLPRIFEEHYRTAEAARHHRESSGLGLAIVRKVALANGIGVRVQSRPGVGTTFGLQFPSACKMTDTTGSKENRDGVSADRG